MPIKATRALLTAALDGSLNAGQFRKDPHFRLRRGRSAAMASTTRCSTPRQTWTDTEAYDHQARKLVNMFADNFAQYVPYIADDVKAAAIG